MTGPLDRPTREAYERSAAEWEAARAPSAVERWRSLLAAVEMPEGAAVDLGCGPGWHVGGLPRPQVAVDASRAMLDLVPKHAPDARRVQADLGRLPFAPATIGAALATKAYVHLDAEAVPRALAELHRATRPDAPMLLSFFGSGPEASGPTVSGLTFTDDELPGRCFSSWHPDDLDAVLDGAGITVLEREIDLRSDSVPHVWVAAIRRRSLPDTVGPGMRLLICGLNPSLRAADAGVGFVTPGNRFWPAAMAAGLVSRDRDPFHALDAHDIGMTDLAKRATRRAEELAPDEYRDGRRRLERMVAWLKPDAVCFVGLAGYRVAVDRRAVAGPQEERIGDRPVYVMPSTSGLNAHSRLEDLTDHLRAAASLA